DVVGYSKLLVNEQIEPLQELNQIVRGTECFRSAEASGKLNRVPKGDGMALLFFRNLEEPVRCALEISRTLKDHPDIQVRMGVHSGFVGAHSFSLGITPHRCRDRCLLLSRFGPGRSNLTPQRSAEHTVRGSLSGNIILPIRYEWIECCTVSSGSRIYKKPQRKNNQQSFFLC
ncbi:MAG TPA: hypothetical protein VGI41_11800, partial [Candidatus Udaeobacter sp.]